MSVPDAPEASSFARVVSRCIFNPATAGKRRRGLSVESPTGHEGNIIKLQTSLLPDGSCLALCLIKLSCCSKACSCVFVVNDKLSIRVVDLTQVQELSKCDHVFLFNHFISHHHSVIPFDPILQVFNGT